MRSVAFITILPMGEKVKSGFAKLPKREMEVIIYLVL